MGGAGAGSGVVLMLAVMLGGSFLIWLFVAIFAWIMVLPGWAMSALFLSLLTGFFHVVIGNTEPDTFLNSTAIFSIIVLFIGGILAVPAVLVFRFKALFFNQKTRKE